MNQKLLSPLVKLKNIRKSFGTKELRFEVLHGINLEVYPGELLMLIGPSGSGKTTLISIIAAILSYDEGNCTLFERDLNQLSDPEKTLLRREHLGYVFQAFNLIPMLTITENVAIPLLLNGVNSKDALTQSKKRLEQFGLGNKVKAYPQELSGGQQQRVAIARAVIHHPDLIVCDEPTSALDQENGKLILTQMREIVTKENKALIVVTHDSRIFDFADRMIQIEDGQIIKDN